jgi:hypothetical protein
MRTLSGKNSRIHHVRAIRRVNSEPQSGQDSITTPRRPYKDAGVSLLQALVRHPTRVTPGGAVRVAHFFQAARDFGRKSG